LSEVILGKSNISILGNIKVFCLIKNSQVKHNAKCKYIQIIYSLPPKFYSYFSNYEANSY